MTLRTTDPAGVGRALLAGVRRHAGGRELDDDTTILVLHHNAANPPQQSMGERIRMWGKMLGVTG